MFSLRTSLAIVLALALSGCSINPPTVDQPAYAPGTSPPPPIVVRPPPPSTMHTWVPGYWAWNHDAWTWYDGYWARPPYPGARWAPGRWKYHPRGWAWMPGHWRGYRRYY